MHSSDRQWRPWRQKLTVIFSACLVLMVAIVTVLEASAYIGDSISLLRVAYRGKHGKSDSIDLYQDLNSSETRYIKEDKYSIIIATYNRYETFLYFLDHYGRSDMPRLDAIFIIWGLGAVDPPESLNLSDYRVPVYLQRKNQQTLNQRFIIPPQMRTNAALHIDDDISVEGSSVEFMFDVWQAFGRYQHRIVGRVPRLLGRSKDGRPAYTYGGVKGKKHDMVLTGVAFLDKTMAHWFWENDATLVQARKYVDEHLNCEDLLMNYVVARKTGLSPILMDVPGDFRPVRVKTGLSLGKGNAARRTACLQEFDALFGDVLKTSNMAVLPESVVQNFWDYELEVPKAWEPTGRPWGEGKTFTE